MFERCQSDDDSDPKNQLPVGHLCSLLFLLLAPHHHSERYEDAYDGGDYDDIGVFRHLLYLP